MHDLLHRLSHEAAINELSVWDGCALVMREVVKAMDSHIVNNILKHVLMVEVTFIMETPIHIANLLNMLV